MFCKKNLTRLFFAAIFMATAAGVHAQKIRKPVDTIGFATCPWQMDSVVKRIFATHGRRITATLKRNGIRNETAWKMAICPHDDYTYAGWLYPAVLKNVKAPVVILVGVAHKAKKFSLENKIVFESFDRWAEPYGPVKISPLREKIMKKLPSQVYVVHDSMQIAEHSLEAIVPFLQYYNRQVEIVPILVPYMPFSRMDEIAGALARSLGQVMKEQKLEWGKDVAIVISTDAVHYGDEDWGGLNYAPYGCDSSGYRQAVAREHEIIDNCLTGNISKMKARSFTKYTVQDTNYRAYRWTWCGRYSVPFGLLTAWHLEHTLVSLPLQGVLLGYANSIMEPAMPVEDLKMGKTAGAGMHHWVGYASVGYK